MVLREVMEEEIVELNAKEEVKSVMEEAISELTIKDEETEIVRELRDLPLANYLLKIENFSQLANANVENYRPSVFKVGGYIWRLSLYPKGNKKISEEKYISVYFELWSPNA
ncbi:uncharacterized protein LOC110008846 [Jatropha curcas]|uniref:uncharacterized protein LOC110008846 n=1 Tax=Jatropha curcas TaxID=180498 RepID=UPI0009D6E176|nr:uncharacterized protein LOC110008846 [Jatropha curcas]